MLAVGPILQLAWASAAAIEFNNVQLLELLRRSRASNFARGITGLLLYHRRSFLQLMEGPPHAVIDVFERRIQRDVRHTDITLLLKRETEGRAFPDFSMAFIDTRQRPLGELPGFRDYRDSQAGFLGLHGDFAPLARIINGFHEGDWHQALTR